MDIKIEMLTSLTAALQQADSFSLAESNKLAESILGQGLLTEQAVSPVQQRLKWSTAAKLWMDNLLGLMSGTQSPKSQVACRLAAVSLTGCSSNLFVAHHNTYVLRVLELLRKQAQEETSQSQLWPVVTAAFTRIEQLLHLPGLRREASSLAPKLIAALQPTFAAGTNETGNASPDLLRALNAGLHALPTAFRAHQKTLATFASALLAAPHLHGAVKLEAALLYSLCPRLTGDAETWSSHMQNVLYAIHTRLDIAYLGMDDSALKAASKAALSPEAQPLMAPSQSSGASQQGRLTGQSVHSVGAVQTALDQASRFLDTLERMLTLSFPVAVPIPCHGILLLLTRVLHMDDSARQAGQVPPSASAYLALLAALPALHTCALQLMQTLAWAGQGALLQHHASMARLLASLLRQFAASAAADAAPAAMQLRQQVYRTAADLAARGGVGVGSVLGPEAMKCALLELYGVQQSKKRPAEDNLANGHVPKKQKKTKKDDALPSLDAMLADGAASNSTGQPAGTDFTNSPSGPQEAALHLLEALLQAWGPSMSHQQRNQVDAIAAHIASTAGLAIEHMSQSYEGSSNQAGTVAVQLAALKAMLASVLCPAPHRAPFLPQALMLFTQGLHSPAPQIAAFSQKALLSVEGIIHPRAGHTILQPHRSSASTQPHTSASTSTDHATDLGMPKLWSAVMPVADSRPQQQQLPLAASDSLAADETEVLASAAGTAAARDVLRAGQVYATAVAKLEAALGEQGTVAAPATADTSNVNAVVETRASSQQQTNGSALHGLANGMAAAAGLATGVTASHAATLSAATPMSRSGLKSLGAQEGTAAVPDVGSLNTSIGTPAGAGALEHEKHALQQSSSLADAAAPVQRDAIDEDGYISLEQEHSAALKAAATDTQQAKSAAAVSLLAGAESSDSQGSLPEIDSGDSSDSSDVEMC